MISPTPWTYTENGDVVDADGCVLPVSGIARTHPARFEFAADRDSFKYILSVIAKAEDRQ